MTNLNLIKDSHTTNFATPEIQTFGPFVFKGTKCHFLFHGIPVTILQLKGFLLVLSVYDYKALRLVEVITIWEVACVMLQLKNAADHYMSGGGNKVF